MVRKEVVEVRSNYKKSYFWWCWLLWRNSIAWGEQLTSQLSWVAVWLSVTCLPCLPSGRTLLFRSDLFVAGRVVSWERYESSKLGRLERCMRVVSWQGGKGGRIVRWQDQMGGMVVRWQVRKGGTVVRWQGGKGGRVVRWQSGRFLVLFEDGRRRVSPRFHLFVSDVNETKEQGEDILAWPQRWKDSP